MERGTAELGRLGGLLASSRERAHVRAVLVRDEDDNTGWQLRYACALVGAPPPGWLEQRWTYSSIMLVACTVPAAGLAPLCSGDPTAEGTIRLGAVEAAVPTVQDTVLVERQPSFSRFDRPPLSVPTTDYRLSAADSNYTSRQAPPGKLVGRACPSFPDLPSAWRAFAAGDFSLSGAQPLPHELALVRIAQLGAWLGAVHITATKLSVEVHGRKVAGCELELFGVFGRQALSVDRPGTVDLDLVTGLPADAWLWLKRGTAWLDYRVLDPQLGWATRGDLSHAGIEIDIPIDPQTTVEALLAAGEGPLLEYKSRLPGTAPSERRSALKTAAAFANGDGGTIIFGIDRDEVTIVGLDEGNGIDDARLRDRLGDLIRATIIPTPSFTVQAHKVNGRTILVLSIEPGLTPPYGFVAGSNNRDKPEFFVRRGANTYPAQPADLRESIVNRGTAAPSNSPLGGGW